MEGRVRHEILEGGGDYQFLQSFQSCKRHHEKRERGERNIRRHYSIHERQTRRATIRDNNKKQMREFVCSQSLSTVPTVQLNIRANKARSLTDRRDHAMSPLMRDGR
ncbi:hypothetical protein J6590_057777 [Homalodisca vitripennis]|nr:hypothetical protein J6590_057777 [Homalodisca vitripennis]